MQTKDSFRNAKTTSLHSLNFLLGRYWGCTSKTIKETKVAEHMDPCQEKNGVPEEQHGVEKADRRRKSWNRKSKTVGEQKILIEWFLPSLQFETLPTETTQYSPISKPMLWSYVLYGFALRKEKNT